MCARFGADSGGARAHLLHRLGDEVVGQLGDILAPLAQRRHLDRNHAQPKVQVLAEFPRGDQGLEVLVGRRDHARLELERLDAADPVELALLQHAQQLGLQLDRQVADFVEEDRAGVGHLEFAGAPLGRAGERAALVPEQLALEQAMRNRGAVDGDERRAPSRRFEMNRARDQLLAGAALAAEQDGRVVGDHAPDQLINFLHRGAAADYLAADQLAIDLVLQAIQVRGLRADFNRALDGGRDQVEIGERLGQVVVRAALHRLDRVVHRAGGGDHDDQRADAFAMRGRQHVESAGARHDDVEQGDVESIAAQRRERGRAVDGLVDAMAVGFKPMAQNEADGGIVVGDQNSRAGARLLHPFGEVLARYACAHGGGAHGLQS